MSNSIQTAPVVRLVTCVGALLIALCGISVADKDALQEQLAKLRTATRIVIMAVHPGRILATNVNEERLPQASCVYQIENGSGPAFGEALTMLNAGIIEYEIGGGAIDDIVPDKRIGIVFKNGDSNLQTFYFEDWGFGRNINGISGRYRLLATVDFQNQLRKLLGRKDVTLIESNGYICSVLGG
jgi:hypothetical protein